MRGTFEAPRKGDQFICAGIRWIAESRLCWVGKDFRIWVSTLDRPVLLTSVEEDSDAGSARPFNTVNAALEFLAARKEDDASTNRREGHGQGGGSQGDPGETRSRDLEVGGAINHPRHYGAGPEDPYEAIKIIEAWGLDFCLGNAVKYVSRAGKKGGPEKEAEDLQKAVWYLQRRLSQIKKEADSGTPPKEKNGCSDAHS